ncbi:helix-turn-helix domain-containing protein [Caryophanon latum]|uniref:HTH cro/C1-type domain-containing protein n=1 Tax=Caryophanon latum TaxID=33977 RepID=A0A1C0YUL3_9BACL|nr:helix-turn-helix transcriptional regulator [Caryophanon latum]OCS90831.1 hypothetical protein A6K76_01915 [Caryophanon latum]
MCKMVTLIESWMMENGVTTIELAARMGVSETLVRAMLSGERRIPVKRIESLSNITRIPVSTLLGVPENNFAGYTVMVRGGIKQLNAEQERLIMDVALLANEYDRLRGVSCKIKY